MNKIKDFIYDFNDIVVALLIIAVTAGILFWRVDTIMDYPQYLAAKMAGPQVEDPDFTDVNLQPGQVDENLNTDPEDVVIPGTDEQTPGGEGQGQEPEGGQTQGQEGQEGEQDPEGQGGEQPQGGEQTQGGTAGKLADGKTTEDAAISIPTGVSSSKIGDILVEAGLVESKEAFNKAVSDKNAEQKLKAGDFKIPAGSTVADIVNIISK